MVNELNLDTLLRYAVTNVIGFPPSPSNFTFSKFEHGQSNPTYLMQVGSGALVKCYVLRKKPPGKLLQSAQVVEREFQLHVLQALGNHTVVSVLKVFCLCTDPSVIGTAFYIMDFLELMAHFC
ncbi:putative protein kinase [Rosa chinensis]|uniref:Aminoglycoside phosphotransferase domain-containing protein n=1 Tax=Rosa chinensis TaxID=74649 RepID=A0A2P6Q1K5_ROSCH|nr:putative protein kinase [Rosa chinensis]